MSHISLDAPIRMGVDYYPEHWDRNMWEQDVKLMHETGIKVVRLGEFAWSVLEPEEGKFDFTWLDDAIDLFHQYGIEVIIGTPTATPPRWLSDQYPDILPIFANEDVFHAGVRGHRCYSSPSLSKYTAIIVTKLAQRYATHPAVIAWQTDNEFSMLNCHCDVCNEQFRKWVQHKYGSLEVLNQEWGTVVWSGTYSHWTQVTTPLGGSPFQNPSYLLDYARFQWEGVAQFQQMQIDILRQYCPSHVITHNFHSYPQLLDLYQVGEGLDVASFDYYPNPSPHKGATAPYSGALSLDLTRGIKRKNFWIMEQLSGSPGCWFPMWRTPQPGFIRAYAWQTIARGADLVVHFRWRSAVAGAEQFWHGLIDHSNVPGRRFNEFAQLCQEVNQLGTQLQGTKLVNEVAILHSFEQAQALHIQPQVEGMEYYENIKHYHRAITKLGIGCDVINWQESLAGYKVIIAPSLYVLNAEAVAKLEKFVADGGRLILTYRTGVKEMNNQCVMAPLPGLLSPLAGIVVEEYDPIGNDRHHIIDQSGHEYDCEQWADIIQLNTAKAIAWYNDDYYAGKPAVTVNTWGHGKVYYVGTHIEERAWMDRLKQLAEELHIRTYGELPEGVQISVRTGDNGSYLFLLNLSRLQHHIELPEHYPSVLNPDNGHQGSMYTIAPYGVEILKL